MLLFVRVFKVLMSLRKPYANNVPLKTSMSHWKRCRKRDAIFLSLKTPVVPSPRQYRHNQWHKSLEYPPLPTPPLFNDT